jgi:hypothetical protein
MASFATVCHIHYDITACERRSVYVREYEILTIGFLDLAIDLPNLGNSRIRFFRREVDLKLINRFSLEKVFI